MESIASCIKETGNWSKLKKEHIFDNPDFKPSSVSRDIVSSSPKINALLAKIKELDERDLQKDGMLYKHFIYSDIKSGYGAKLIASVLASKGYHHAYSLEKGSRGMSFSIQKNLERYQGKTFATLTSVPFFERPIGITFRRELLKTFNSRPDNTHGQKIRIIILDSGFREGVDLFDIKYVHLFEPIMTKADEKQAIGRATRFCGQKGLRFNRQTGWPIYVHKYETTIPPLIKNSIVSHNEKLGQFETFFDLFMKFTNIDPKKITFANELEPLVIMSAVDRYLTRNIHNFSIKENVGMEYWDKIFDTNGGGGGAKLSKFIMMQKNIRQNFLKYAWPKTKVENGCVGGPVTNEGTTSVTFSPTQDFVRHYFTSTSKYKGILLMHSVGTGKTCTAIATASTSFEKDDYTIIYVTRHTLKADVWKNMFGMTCSVIIQEMLKQGKTIPEAEAKRLRLIKAWFEPMSYKQFSNMLQGKNSLFDQLVERNGKDDPLKKTLVIIDEAHKLFAPDVSGSEKPDIETIKKALVHSYDTSGKDSARIMLMTATPYTDDPMDMMKLLNLCRPQNKQLPETFEDFSSMYLNEEGKFTDTGKLKYLDDITGYISYLNREKDVRSFSYPIFENITVPLSNYEFEKELKQYTKLYFEHKHLNETIGNSESFLKTEAINRRVNMEKELEKELKEQREDLNKCIVNERNEQNNKILKIKAEESQFLKQCKTDVFECVEVQKNNYKAKADVATEDVKNKIKDCKNLINDCKDDIKSSTEQRVLDLKEELVNTIASVKERYADLKKRCPKGDKECKERLKKEETDRISALKDANKSIIQRLKSSQKTQLEECKGKDTECKERLKDTLQNEINSLKQDLEFDIKECSESKTYTDCVGKAKEASQSEIKKIKEVEPCKSMKESLIAYETLQKRIINDTIKKYIDDEQVKIDFDKELLEKKYKSLIDKKLEVSDKAKSDNSQRMRLEHCLRSQKVKHGYKDILKGKYLDVIDENEEQLQDEEPTENSNVKANVYMIHGHGSEDIKDFDKRQTLPNDKVLVVFPVCGRPNWLNISCMFSDMFSSQRYMKWLCDPVKYQEQIEKTLGYPIRIYLPGEKVPYMSTNLFLNFEMKKTVIVKSGVFPLCNVPKINRERFHETTDNSLSLGHTSCFKYLGVIDDPSQYNGSVHHEVFKGSVYKDGSKRETYEKLKHRDIQIKDIINDVGPGIYYYTGCRVGKDVEKNRYMRILADSAKQQEEKHRSVKMNSFKKYLKVEKNVSDSLNKSASLPKTPTPPKPESISPQKPKPPTPIKRIENSKEEKTKLKLINTKIQEFWNAYNGNSTKNNTLLEDINVWTSDIDNMKQTMLTKTVKDKISDLEICLKNNIKPTPTLVFDTKGEFISIKVADEYKVNNHKYKNNHNLIGVIPNKSKNISKKCNTEMILKRIKKLFKNNALHKLDIIKDPKDWNEEEFTKLCETTKSLYLKK